jgi:UDP-N-acetylglucosamine 1-carboxyvinyltransferase
MTTQPYPGFPTDLQAQLMALLCLGDGISVITERIFPDRFLHVGELNRMGARIRKEGPTAIIQGVKELQGASVMASDLRASAALVLPAWSPRAPRGSTASITSIAATKRSSRSSRRWARISRSQ